MKKKKVEEIDERFVEVERARKLILEMMDLNNVSQAEGMYAIQLVYCLMLVEAGVSYKQFCENMEHVKKTMARLFVGGD